MKHYESKAVVCPFYHQEQPTKIHCDGFSTENTVQISFKTKEDKIRHRKNYCLNLQNHKQCPIYEAISTQYEEGLDE